MQQEGVTILTKIKGQIILKGCLDDAILPARYISSFKLQHLAKGYTRCNIAQ